MKRPKKPTKKPRFSTGDPRASKSTLASLKKRAKKEGLKIKRIRTSTVAEADYMGRIMAHQFALEMDKIREEEIEGIPQQLRDLIADAAFDFSRLIRTGPGLLFNKAQDDLMLACDLYKWYLRWQAQNQASSIKK